MRRRNSWKRNPGAGAVLLPISEMLRQQFDRERQWDKKYLENVEQHPGELPDHQARKLYFVRGDFMAVDKKASNYRLAFVREQMDAMRDVLRLNTGAILYTRTPLQKPKRKCVS